MAVNDRTLRLAAGMRLQMGAAVDAESQTLLLSWARAWNELAPEWEAALDDLVAASKDGRWPTPRQVARAKRAQEALAATESALTALGRDMGVRMLRELPQLTRLATLWQARIIGSQLPGAARLNDARLGVGWDRTDPRALDAIVTRTAGQVQALHWPLEAQAVAAMKAEITRGIAVGDNPRVAAARMFGRVHGRFNGGLNRALVIARTEMIDAHRAAELESRRANSDVLRGWAWQATLDTRTCESCWSQHGSIHALDEPGPLDHQQGRCTAIPATKSWRDLGYNIDEPPSSMVDARAVFDDLPAAQRIQILGPEKVDLLDSGQIGWSDLSTLRHTDGWRDSFVPTPIAVLRDRASA